MKWMLTGDCHGVFIRFDNLPKDEEIGMIILGDAGVNFYLNKTDDRKKKEICENYSNITFYCVRGNHECRPQGLSDIEKIFDENVHGVVYYQSKYPNIRYFLDYGLYDIGGYSCYVIGGAYSVDKYWRLMRAGLTEETNDFRKTYWFPDEMLTQNEMNKAIEQLYNFKDMGKHIDFMFSHTCPYEWEPRDMFLGSIDQSTVDNSMELWMNEIKDNIHSDIWCFGHFHADRIERPHVEQYYHDIEELDVIYQRWQNYDATGELPWYLVKGPMFYANT